VGGNSCRRLGESCLRTQLSISPTRSLRDDNCADIDALLSVRAIARDKFDGICAILKDC